MAEYQRRRECMVIPNALPGVSCRKPQGAFYTFPNITSTGLSSRSVASCWTGGCGSPSRHDFGQYGRLPAAVLCHLHRDD
jgi:hypothetical protein